MKELTRSNSFKREYKLILKRNKNPQKLETVLKLLKNDSVLPAKYRDHKLSGRYEGSRELHIEPDWLLVYKIVKQLIILQRTGTHSDLFK